MARRVHRFYGLTGRPCDMWALAHHLRCRIQIVDDLGDVLGCCFGHTILLSARAGHLLTFVLAHELAHILTANELFTESDIDTLASQLLLG
jgi:hypothetical protein